MYGKLLLIRSYLLFSSRPNWDKFIHYSKLLIVSEVAFKPFAKFNDQYIPTVYNLRSTGTSPFGGRASTIWALHCTCRKERDQEKKLHRKSMFKKEDESALWFCHAPRHLRRSLVLARIRKVCPQLVEPLNWAEHFSSGLFFAHHSRNVGQGTPDARSWVSRPLTPKELAAPHIWKLIAYRKVQITEFQR